MSGVTNKEDLIGKRLTWEQIQEHFPNQSVGLTDVKFVDDDGATVEYAKVTYINKSERDLIFMAFNGECIARYTGLEGAEHMSVGRGSTLSQQSEVIVRQLLNNGVVADMTRGYALWNASKTKKCLEDASLSYVSGMRCYWELKLELSGDQRWMNEPFDM